MLSGVPWTIPMLPVIDEEYFETIAVYDSVINAKKEYVIAELGARWGTWGSRAVAFLRKVNPMPYQVYFVEPLELHCDGLKEVMKENDIKYTLDCDYATADSFLKWSLGVKHVDMLDVDIQGAETELFSDDKLMQVVEHKVKRLIVGTHSKAIHKEMRKLFAHWHVLVDTPFSKDTKCLQKTLRSENKVDRVIFEQTIELGCYRNSSYGRIGNWDGELIIDNPRFYTENVLFPGEKVWNDKVRNVE